MADLEIEYHALYTCYTPTRQQLLLIVVASDKTVIMWMYN